MFYTQKKKKKVWANFTKNSVQTICSKCTTQYALPARQHREQMHKESYSALWSIRLGAVINQAN